MVEKIMKLTKREVLLITNALYILECQIIGNELDHDIESDLGRTRATEVRILMNRFEKENNENIS
ncbi:hypothetical protein KW795_02715 [Candidatus Microgenomates bacterium]|nr:hypothetical protein [Candidatus Microgenomates bacterium]